MLTNEYEQVLWRYKKILKIICEWLAFGKKSLAWGLELRQEVRSDLYQFLLNQHSFTFQGPRNLLVTLVTPDGSVQEQNKVESESDNQDPGSVSSPL